MYQINIVILKAIRPSKGEEERSHSKCCNDIIIKLMAFNVVVVFVVVVVSTVFFFRFGFIFCFYSYLWLRSFSFPFSEFWLFVFHILISHRLDVLCTDTGSHHSCSRYPLCHQLYADSLCRLKISLLCEHEWNAGLIVCVREHERTHSRNQHIAFYYFIIFFSFYSQILQYFMCLSLFRVQCLKTNKHRCVKEQEKKREVEREKRRRQRDKL